MAARSLLFLLLPILVACRKDDPSAQAGGTPASPPWTKENTPLERYVPGDMVPPLDVLGEGKFTDKGMAAAFEEAVGWPMPDYMKPKEGIYRVRNVKDRGGTNRAGHSVYYSVPPEKALHLADEVEKTWREKFGNDPAMTVGRTVCPTTYTAGTRTINAGAVGIYLYETYATYDKIWYQMSFDPVSGEVSLGSRRGRVDDPTPRPDPEKERLEAEREKRLLEEADREWEEKQRKWALEKKKGG
jgi:hypothetical protein